MILAKIQCQVCEGEVSKDAFTCPHCGHPLVDRAKLAESFTVNYIVIMGVLMLLWWLIMSL